MLPLPAFFNPSAIYARVLNALLRRESWATDQLSRHSGKIVCFVVGSGQGRLLIKSNGQVQPAQADIVPDVTLTIPSDKLSQLPGLLQARDPSLIASLLHIQGDAGLATVVSGLAKDLRWDIEDDMSQVLGDIPAARLIGAGKMAMAGAKLAASRLGGNVAEYLSEESGLMVNRRDYSVWTTRLLAIESQLNALDKRVQALSFTTATTGRAR